MKHILITGGSDGLGKATAKLLIEKGHKVTILSHNPETTKATAEELKCGYAIADVSDYKSVQPAIKEAESKQAIDVLINNAGLWIQGPLEDNDPERIKKVLDVNTLGPIYCTRAVIPAMKQRKSGMIINISSQGGFYAKSERGVYTATKWGLTGFTRAMLAELKPFNISVVGLFPGALKNTGIFTKAGNDRDMSKALDPVVVAEAIAYAIDLPDGVTANEIGLESLSY